MHLEFIMMLFYLFINCISTYTEDSAWIQDIVAAKIAPVKIDITSHVRGTFLTSIQWLHVFPFMLKLDLF